MRRRSITSLLPGLMVMVLASAISGAAPQEGAAQSSPRIAEAICADPVVSDAEFPDSMAELTIPSGANRMSGVLYIAQGKNPHPTVLLLAGFPGNETNADLAQIIRRSGWNVLLFHYRGSWGSEGAYSWSNAVEDVASAVRFLREEKNASQYRTDPRRLVLVGYSLGGWVALMAAARDPSVRSVASISGVNLGGFGKAAKDPKVAAGSAAYLDGAMLPLRVRGASGEALVREMVAQAEEYDLLNQVDPLCSKSVLLLGGKRDKDIPIDQHHVPLVKAFQEKGAKRVSQVVIDTDHAYSDHRIALAEALLSWLEEQR